MFIRWRQYHSGLKHQNKIEICILFWPDEIEPGLKLGYQRTEQWTYHIFKSIRTKRFYCLKFIHQTKLFTLKWSIHDARKRNVLRQKYWRAIWGLVRRWSVCRRKMHLGWYLLCGIIYNSLRRQVYQTWQWNLLL